MSWVDIWCSIRSVVSLFATNARTQIPSFCWHSSPRHQTWQPPGQQQLCAQGASDRPRYITFSWEILPCASTLCWLSEYHFSVYFKLIVGTSCFADTSLGGSQQFVHKDTCESCWTMVRTQRGMQFWTPLERENKVMHFIVRPFVI